MANRYDIIHIDFQASAKGANAAIESIRKEAEAASNKVTELKAKIAEGRKAGTDSKILEGWNDELRVAERRFRQFSTAQKELVKGMRALDEGVKMFNDGSLSAMNAAFQKTVNNAAKLAQTKLETGTKEWRQMGALMQETEQNYARMQRDTDNLIESLQNGGTVFRKTLEDEKKGLQDLLQVLPYMGTEYRKAEEQLKFLAKTTDEMVVKERQLKGEIVNTDDARRVSLQLTEKGAETARRRAAAADQEIEKGKQTIATLEEERRAREETARATADRAARYREDQQMHEDEIERLGREIEKEQQLASTKKNGVEALKAKAQTAAEAADEEVRKQTEANRAYDEAGAKVEKLREELAKMGGSVQGSSKAAAPAEAVRAGAEAAAEAVKKEGEEAKKATGAKKESIEIQEKENASLEELDKRAKELIADREKLYAERKTLTEAQQDGIRAAEAEADAVRKQANAYAELSREEAQALLNKKQALATFKSEGGGMNVTNREEAQKFLFDTLRSINGGKLGIEESPEKMSRLFAEFQSRYGLKDDGEALAAVRSLVTGGGLVGSGGFATKFFITLKENSGAVAAYNKEIKDLTDVINGEVKAVEEDGKAKQNLEKINQDLAAVNKKIEANERESVEVGNRLFELRNGYSRVARKEAQANEDLADSTQKVVKSVRELREEYKDLSKEEALRMRREMTATSTIGWKNKKLDASNLEQVQAWIYTQARKLNPDTMDESGTVTKSMKRGVIQLGKEESEGKNNQLASLLKMFKTEYGLEGRNAEDLFKEVVASSGGLFKGKGLVDFSKGQLEIPYDEGAVQERINRLAALVSLTRDSAPATDRATESTKKNAEAARDAAKATVGQTDAVKAQEEEVMRQKKALDDANAEYEKRYAKLRDMKKKLGDLPKSGADALMARDKLKGDIEDYDENFVKPARAEKNKIQGIWKKSVKKLTGMMGLDTEETEKNTEAENQNAEATERSAKSKRGKKKAAEESAKATDEETKKSADQLAKEKELADAEKALADAKKKKEDQDKKATDAVKGAEDAAKKADDADRKHIETLDNLHNEQEKHKADLKQLNEENRDTVAANEEAQKQLAETNARIQEQGEKIRDAERIKAQAQTDGIEKTEQAIRILQEENNRIDQNSFTWKRNAVEIRHLQEALDEMKGKPALMMMEQRMKNVGALSASAVTETRRFWEAMVAGAERGSERMKEAEAHLKAITEEEQKRSMAATKQQARGLFGDLSKMSGEEIRAAIDAGKRLIETYDSGSPAAQRLAQAILNAEEHMKSYGLEAERAARREAAAVEEAAARRREQDQLMRQQLDQGTSLSESALKAQQQYWQRLIDDPKTATESLAGYRYELERTMELQEQQAAKTRDERAARLGGTLSNFSEAEVREAIEAGKQLIQTYKVGSDEATTLSKNIVVAEEYVKEYGLEAQRAAQREAQAVADAAKKRKEADDLMRHQLDSLGASMSQSALQAQQQYWQRLIDDPKTAAESLEEYRQNLDKVRMLQDLMAKDAVNTAGEEVLGRMRGDVGYESKISENQRKEDLAALKAYRDALPKEGNADVLKEIDYYLKQLGDTAKETGQDIMSINDALMLASKAGTKGFAATQQELQSATKAIEHQRDAIIQTIKAKRESGAATDAEEKELADLTKKLRDLKFEQDNFNMSQAKMQALMEKPANAVNLDELRAAIKRADAELHRMEGSLGENSEEYQRFAAQVKNAKNQLKEMEGQSRATASAFEKAWTRLKTYVVMYVGANAALQRIMGTLGDVMELSDKMGEVRKTTGFTADEVGRLSENLKKMDTRTSITGLLDLSVAAGQLGLKTEEDVQGFTEAANKLMVALPEMGREGATEMLKVALATGEIDKIRRQMQEGIIDGSSATAVAMEKVGSTIDRLRATSAATAPAITDFVKRVGAVGAQSGISIDQVAALGSTVDALGMRVEMSATALSRMIPAIKNNAFAIGQVIGKTEEYIKMQFAEGRGINVILDIFDAIKKSGRQSADDIEAMFGGSMQEIMKELNQQGARAGIVFAGLSQNVDELRRQLGVAEKAYKDNIAIQQEYDKMNETTAAKWERMKNQLEEMFVGDRTQQFFGWVIDNLRAIVDFISGRVGPALKALNTAVWTLFAAWSTFKMGLGEGIFLKTAKGVDSLSAALFGAVTKTKDAIVIGARYIFTLDEQKKAAIKAEMAQKDLNRAMVANVWMAVVAAVGMLIYKYYEWTRATREAVAEAGRFNQKVYEEQQALNKLFEPLSRSNLAQEERRKLIADINSQYGKYLGYMLSETTSAVQLADAHALIAKRIREEALERRIAEQEKKVYEKHDEDVNAAYGGIEKAVRGGAKGGTDVQEVADMLKSHVDRNMDRLIESGKSLPKGFVEEVNGMTERLVQDGKLTRQGAREARSALYKYLDEAKSQAIELREATQNLRADVRGVQRAIQTDLTNNLKGLIGNIANIARQQQKPAATGPLAPAPQGAQLGRLPKAAWQGGGTETGFGLDFSGQDQPQVNIPLPGDKPKIDEKNIEQVRQYVQYQDNLRGLLQANADSADKQAQATIEAAKAWLDDEKEVERLRKIVAKSDRTTPGSPTYNPYGSFTVMDSYDKWSADALVDRKKQMLEYVKAMANGADVQAILSQDKKFMDEATRKGIKNVRDAIEWYNSERLKIQEELADRHLTNEGGWANPSKAKGRRTRMPMAESAIAELERYYQWRKEVIEEKRAEEGMSEAEYNRRLEALEMEHLQKRSDLRQSYITEDKKFVRQFRDWWKSVRELDAVEWELIEAEVKVATERDRKYIGMNAQKDLTSMNAIVVKQLKSIEDIINKERPFNGITDNLEENLTKMRILFADFDQQRSEALKRGAGKDELDRIDAAADGDRMKRLSAILGMSENAYSLTVDEMMKRLGDAGMQSLADALNSSENGEKMKRALLAQLHVTYDAVQDAIKKEASQIKKQVDIMWNDVTEPGASSIKQSYEKAINALGLQQDQVSRGNSLIGAGAASERVADKLAIKQLQVRLAMQDHYYKLVKAKGEDHIRKLEAEAELHKKNNEHELAEIKLLDAKHARQALNLTLAEEENKKAEQRVAIANQLEESQNRLYQSLREWADLLSSGMRDVFEASNAGNAEYYNELAKMNLTGKGGPGAGTYVVIENEGTEDATAHYEYLDERAALERQREIEQQNAQAEAWKKLWDELNMKMNDQITDMINASLQQDAIDANTTALGLNTQALYDFLSGMTGGSSDFSDASRLRRNENGMALDESGKVIAPIQPADVETGTPKSLWPLADEEVEKIKENQAALWDNHVTVGTEKLTEMSETVAGMPSIVQNPYSDSEEEVERVIENSNRKAQAEIDAADSKTQAVVENAGKEAKAIREANKKEESSTSSAYAKMAAACNMYGLAYQTVTNDNLSAAQKFQLFALQAAGQTAIGMLTTDLLLQQGKAKVELPGILGKAASQLGPIAGPIAFAAMTALLGGLMGLAVSAVSKSKSQISQVTGASASAGRLATGMMTYASGNVDAFTDPGSLTPGRSYNVDAADGRTYRAKYTGTNPSTHLTNGPEFHLAGERGREMIIDAGTTRQITMNENEIWHAIQTLSAGGRMPTTKRRGRGVRTFADGNVEDFESMDNGELTMDNGGMDLAAMQASLDRNSAVQEALLERLNQPIYAQNILYGPDGLPNVIAKLQKEAQRHGEKYL